MEFLLKRPLPIAILVPLCVCLLVGDALFSLAFMDLATGVLKGNMSVLDAVNPAYIASKIGMSRNIAVTFEGALPCSVMLYLLWAEKYGRARISLILLLVLVCAPLLYCFVCGSLVGMFIVIVACICTYVALALVFLVRADRRAQMEEGRGCE